MESEMAISSQRRIDRETAPALEPPLAFFSA